MEKTMHSYIEVTSQEAMDGLLNSIAGFHDSMTKEIHLTNRGAVLPNQMMSMEHRFDAQLLIQSQWEPFAIELLFTEILELHLGSPREYWGASGTVTQDSHTLQRRIKMEFDSALSIVAVSLHYRTRADWLGHEAFLGPEVPAADIIPAQVIADDWRMCSRCSDAWQANPREDVSRCPSCGAITQIPAIGCA